MEKSLDLMSKTELLAYAKKLASGKSMRERVNSIKGITAQNGGCPIKANENAIVALQSLIKASPSILKDLKANRGALLAMQDGGEDIDAEALIQSVKGIYGFAAAQGILSVAKTLIGKAATQSVCTTQIKAALARDSKEEA